MLRRVSVRVACALCSAYPFETQRSALMSDGTQVCQVVAVALSFVCGDPTPF
jgi:hypothetical protein